MLPNSRTPKFALDSFSYIFSAISLLTPKLNSFIQLVKTPQKNGSSFLMLTIVQSYDHNNYKSPKYIHLFVLDTVIE